jgi:hypothetical protein
MDLINFLQQIRNNNVPMTFNVMNCFTYVDFQVVLKDKDGNVLVQFVINGQDVDQ